MINIINKINDEELNKRKKNFEIYIETSKKLFENFIDDKNPFTISLIDNNGLILLVFSAENKPFIEEGMVIDESLGVTAILKTIKNNEECEVLGDEHTFHILKSWSCAASPIRDINGNLVCLISISSEKDKYPSYGLKLAKLISYAIENEVNLKYTLKEIELSKHFAEVVAEGNKDGVLVLDKNANVLYINQVGANILKIDREKAIGKNVTEIVDFTPVILNVFKTHKGYIDKEYIIESPSRGLLHFIKTAVVLRDSNGNFIGVVDFFREIERVRKFVTSYIGAEAKFTFEDIKGESEKIKEVIRIAKIAAKSNSTVLITGETGTGKEMFAQAIHFESERCKGPFVAMNCGAIPRDLAESEFFGYEPGAFTDADKKGRPGKFELADGGTIFLDEIDELPPSLQIKLLRAIEDKVITRIGGTKSLKVNVRIISATNKNIQDLIDKGIFRKDLYYRLNVIHINIPPLRDRKEDIPILINHFINKFNLTLNKNIKGFDESFIEPLIYYDFPGNVRELQNIVERAINISETEILTKDHLPKYIFEKKLDLKDYINLEEIKKDYIVKLLKENDYNISKTSKKLGISRPTLYKIIKKYKLEKLI
ncbi:MAG: sigma 54-interacting transcriptional regulator [Caldisericia bacterium]|nr:sigma 54-interacting transcriptional regulator [Caldisericia bacterium]